MTKSSFEPYVSSTTKMAEFTPKAVVFGLIFGVLFGASTVYLALRAGLTVSASIPIAVIAISVLKRLGGSTILENNMVQTIGSAGESVAAGVVFTLPGFLFLTPDSNGAAYFSYWTIFTLALLGGVLGTLMMVPLRRSLIVDAHHELPYPEGTACASVLIAGEKGGVLAQKAFFGLFFGMGYALLQLVLKVVAEVPTWVSDAKSKIFPAATVNGNITAEYMGIGFILGLRNAGLLVAGGVVAWLGIIPLLASLVPHDVIAAQLVKLGYLRDVLADGAFGYQAATQTFGELNNALYFAYVRQIGAGAVAAGGFMTLMKSMPTIVGAFKGAFGALKGARAAGKNRVDDDLSMGVVVFGSIALVAIGMLLPFLPGVSWSAQLLVAVLIFLFGFFFVTVSSRIVGIIGTSSNPVSGMTIATLMATCIVFVLAGWTHDVYQPMALAVGGIVCIAAANAGATSQDLKTGYLVGATPKWQQVGLMLGVLASAVVIGLTVNVLDNPHLDKTTGTIVHMIGGERYPAPQGTLMATLIKGLLSANLDWQFVLVGVFLALTMEICEVEPLAFAVGVYLPLSTTLPIYVGGIIRWLSQKANKNSEETDSEFGTGNLFSTGLIAGGALMGILVAIIAAMSDTSPTLAQFFATLNLQPWLKGQLGELGYDALGVVAFLLMGLVLFRVATKNQGQTPTKGAT